MKISGFYSRTLYRICNKACGFGLADLPDTVVNRELERYTKALPYTEQMAFRARMYLYFIVSETQKRGMPTELALLPFVTDMFK